MGLPTHNQKDQMVFDRKRIFELMNVISEATEGYTNSEVALAVSLMTFLDAIDDGQKSEATISRMLRGKL